MHSFYRLHQLQKVIEEFKDLYKANIKKKAQ